MICIGARRTEGLLPLEELATEVEKVLRDVAAGSVSWLDRTSMRPQAGGASIFSMVAADAQIVVCKTVSANPLNTSRDLPTVNAVVAVLDSVTGAPLFMLDGPTLTARRTAAVSLAAIRLLHPGAESALLTGTGALARSHLEGLACLKQMKHISIRGRRAGAVARLVQYGRSMGMDCQPALDQGLSGACEIAITVTSSKQPVLTYVGGHTRLVVAVGSYKPTMSELTPEIVAAAAGVYVDTKAGARGECGELTHPELDWSRVQELGELVALPPPPCADGFRLFKSVGHSLWDLAAARVALRLLRQA
jgi:1-piperideine-2-carboxylate/1-pyrroline-2-carboxylate reductase [NAD(P)H]